MTTEHTETLRTHLADALSDADGWMWAKGFDKRKSGSYQGPATAAPRQIDLHRRIDDLPALDDYRLTGSEARR